MTAVGWKARLRKWERGNQYLGKGVRREVGGK